MSVSAWEECVVGLAVSHVILGNRSCVCIFMAFIKEKRGTAWEGLQCFYLNPFFLNSTELIHSNSTLSKRLGYKRDYQKALAT